jgi:hypothetical protein
VRYSRWSYLLTMASMVVVNSVLGVTTAALVGTLAIKAPVAASAAAGIVVGLALLALGLRYEHRRLMPVVLGSPGHGRHNDDDAELTPPSRYAAGGQLMCRPPVCDAGQGRRSHGRT